MVHTALAFLAFALGAVAQASATVLDASTLPTSAPGFSVVEYHTAKAYLKGGHDAVLSMWKYLDNTTGEALKSENVNLQSTDGSQMQEYVLRGMMHVSDKLQPAAYSKSEEFDARYDPFGSCPLKTNKARLDFAGLVATNITSNYVSGFNPAVAKAVSLRDQTLAWLWSDGEKHAINPGTDNVLATQGPTDPSVPLVKKWNDIAEALFVYVTFPSFLLTESFNLTRWFNDRAWASGWKPSPLYAGPMIYKYQDVFVRMTDAKQRRGYYTMTIPQDEALTLRSTPLFIDGQHHKEFRQLLEYTGFARTWPIDLDYVRNIASISYSDANFKTDAIFAVAPLLLKSLMGADYPKSLEAAIKTYCTYGIFGLFGAPMKKWSLGPIGMTWMLNDARTKIADWAKTTPFYATLVEKRDAHFASSPWFQDTSDLSQSIVDVSMFAGAIGVIAMTKECVTNQQKDPAHKKLFRENPEKYLVEAMRLASAVTALNQLFKEEETMEIQGRDITFAQNSTSQLVIATANRDPVKWGKSADQFNPSRSDLADTLSWNGRAEDVQARDFAKAPRHCPGFCLSIKVASAVCAQLVDPQLFKDLEAENKIGGAIQCDVFRTTTTTTTPRTLIANPGPVITSIQQALSIGDTIVQVDSTKDFAVGDKVVIRGDTSATDETNWIKKFGSIDLKNGLQHTHSAGNKVSVVATCANYAKYYACAFGHSIITTPEQQNCADSTQCAATDSAKCCIQTTALCTGFACSAGSHLKPGADKIACTSSTNGISCKPADQGTCCAADSTGSPCDPVVVTTVTTTPAPGPASPCDPVTVPVVTTVTTTPAPVAPVAPANPCAVTAKLYDGKSKESEVEGNVAQPPAFALGHLGIVVMVSLFIGFLGMGVRAIRKRNTRETSYSQLPLVTDQQARTMANTESLMEVA